MILVFIEVSFSTHRKNQEFQTEDNVFSTETGNKSVEKLQNNLIEDIPKDAVWQEVNGSRYKFFVYSAYLDRRSKRQWLVRIIAATRTKNPDKAACIFHYNNEKEKIAAKIVAISENWSLVYSAVFVICNLKNFTSIPLSVSVIAYNPTLSSYATASNNILVNNRNAEDFTLSKNQNKIAICVKPLHSYFDKTLELIEYIELNKILGISHFTFYDASTGPNANCILEKYRNEGLISVLPWRLRMKSKIEIRTEGMFAALNDCLYRNMYIFPYVAFIDTDEFIVPRFNFTLMQLIRWLSSRYNTSTVSSYSFQNAFFYLQWMDDPNVEFANDIEKKLITFRKTRRRIKLNAHKQRSKYIAKPKNVVEVGNHFVWQFFPNQNTLNIPPDIAILHHYRVCEFGGDDCIHLASTVDRILYRNHKMLTCNVAQKWLLLINMCNLPKINFSNVYHVCQNE
ncbi:hypothetical protein PGB90_001322 [Kerria lacca]